MTQQDARDQVRTMLDRLQSRVGVMPAPSGWYMAFRVVRALLAGKVRISKSGAIPGGVDQ